MIQRFAKMARQLMADSHYRNSLFLILSNLGTAVLGFVFWILATRWFGQADVGIAGALISAVTFLTTLSVLGLNVSIIRYLPTAKSPNSVISTALLVTSLAAFGIGIVFILGLGIFSPELAFLAQHPWQIASFVLFTVIANSIEVNRNTFIAFRSSRYVLESNVLFSVAKLVLPLAFVSFGAFGLFTAWMTALALSALFCLLILIKRFSYRWELSLTKVQLKEMFTFSTANYISGFLEIAPISLLPIVATRVLGAEQTAVLYLNFTIVGVLFTLAIAIASSFFAEGSADESGLVKHIQKTARILTVTLVPAVAVMALLSPYLLLIFGQDYARSGANLLAILAVSAIFFGINAVAAIVLRLKNRMKAVISVNGLGAIVILALAGTPAFSSLNGFGWSWLLGQIGMSMLYALAVWHYLRLRPAPTV